MNYKTQTSVQRKEKGKERRINKSNLTVLEQHGIAIPKTYDLEST